MQHPRWVFWAKRKDRGRAPHAFQGCHPPWLPFIMVCTWFFATGRHLRFARHFAHAHTHTFFPGSPSLRQCFPSSTYACHCGMPVPVLYGILASSPRGATSRRAMAAGGLAHRRVTYARDAASCCRVQHLRIPERTGVPLPASASPLQPNWPTATPLLRA